MSVLILPKDYFFYSNEAEETVTKALFEIGDRQLLLILTNENLNSNIVLFQIRQLKQRFRQSFKTLAGLLNIIDLPVHQIALPSFHKRNG